MTTPKSTLQNPIPRPSEQPPEVDFLQNRQDSFPSSQAAFDVKTKQFVPQPRPPPARQVSFDLFSPRERELQVIDVTESFIKSIEKLKKKTDKKSAAIADFSFDKAYCWQDVYQIIKSAETKYLAEHTISGDVRKFFRKIGDRGKSIQSFIGLLPDGNYKTLCGGLTLILSALISHSDIREKMALMMNEFPDDVRECEDYSLIYQGSSMLQQRVEELYVDILKTLDDFVKWYMEGTAKHVKDALLKNQTYAQSIDIQIREIGKSRLRFQQATTKLLHSQGQRTFEAIVKTSGMVQDSHGGIARIEGAVDDAKKGAQETGEALLRRMSGLETQVLNGVQNVLADRTKNAKWQKEIENLRQAANDKDRLIENLRCRVNAISYTPSSLADALGLDSLEDGCPDDVHSAYSKGLKETALFQGRARWAAESSEFVNWIDADESEMLIVQGNSKLEYLSSMSFLAALLHPKLVASSNAVVLTYFCGLHRGNRFNDSAEPSGPLLMAQALLSQILSITTIDWTEGNAGLPLLSLRPEQVKRMNKGSFAAYIELISTLIAALRSHFAAIFVIVDGIDYYDLVWTRDVKRMTKSLASLVAIDERPVGVLKVLFTAATHASGWLQCMEDAVVLNLPSEIDRSRDGFNQLSEA